MILKLFFLFLALVVCWALCVLPRLLGEFTLPHYPHKQKW